jgi:hypothetical protein
VPRRKDRCLYAALLAEAIDHRSIQLQTDLRSGVAICGAPPGPLGPPASVLRAERNTERGPQGVLYWQLAGGVRCAMYFLRALDRRTQDQVHSFQVLSSRAAVDSRQQGQRARPRPHQGPEAARLSVRAQSLVLGAYQATKPLSTRDAAKAQRGLLRTKKAKGGVKSKKQKSYKA